MIKSENLVLTIQSFYADRSMYKCASLNGKIASRADLMGLDKYMNRGVQTMIPVPSGTLTFTDGSYTTHELVFTGMDFVLSPMDGDKMRLRLTVRTLELFDLVEGRFQICSVPESPFLDVYFEPGKAVQRIELKVTKVNVTYGNSNTTRFFKTFGPMISEHSHNVHYPSWLFSEVIVSNFELSLFQTDSRRARSRIKLTATSVRNVNDSFPKMISTVCEELDGKVKNMLRTEIIYDDESEADRSVTAKRTWSMSGFKTS
jgi:hypothetical protein